jgi:antitoxin (DNA-binding transcriptional repressor) of toxin-antitoxin stability system
MAVAELKTHFSEVIEKVRNGDEVGILYGRAKTPVAKIVPMEAPPKRQLIGVLEGKVNFVISDDWKMTPEELADL